MFFDKKVGVPSFASRSQAFDYLFSKLVEDGRDIEDAARRADEFAGTIAKNRGLPDAPEKPKNFVDKGVGILRQINAVRRESPELWGLASDILGGVIGGVIGSRAESQMQEPPKETISEDIWNNE